MTASPSVTAILVAYNSEAVIGSALQALLKEPAIASIVVVDNASSDDTCELLRKRYPAVTLIENSQNDGYGRGNNIALKTVTTPYALLVNPDAVLETGALSELLAATQRYPDAAIIAPALYDEKGELHHSHKRSVFDRETSGDTYTAPDGDCCAEFLSGAVWLMRMEHFKSIGFFDPKIFLYYEDDDLCLRARKAGYGLVLVPKARAMHLMGKSSGKPKPESEFFKQRHLIWSRLYIEEKYRGKAAAKKLAMKLRLTYSVKAALYFLKGSDDKTNRYRGRLEGIFQFSEAAQPRKTA